MMSRKLLDYKGIITDSQAYDEGSIPFTRSNDFNAYRPDAHSAGCRSRRMWADSLSSDRVDQGTI